MSPARTTSLLAGLLALLLVVDVGVWHQRTLATAPLPALPAVAQEQVQRITLVSGEERTVLARSASGWEVVEPLAHPADGHTVAAVLSALEGGVRPEARVQSGDLERYGLDGLGPIRVTLSGTDADLLDLYLGMDAPGGATFVRYPDSDEVFRARVGGRALFDRPPAAWRDPHLWQVPTTRLVGLRVERDDGQILDWQRPATPDSQAPAPWGLDDDPSFPVDPVLMQALAMALSHPRAAATYAADHPGGFDPARGTLILTLDDGQTRRAELGVVGDAGYARVPGRDAVYKLPGNLVQRLVADRGAWADHRLFDLDPRTLTEVEWVTPGRTVRVVPDPRVAGWRIVEPAGLTADQQALSAAIGFLAKTRAEGWIEASAEACGLPGPSSIVLVGSEARTLQIGGPAPGVPGHLCVRSPHAPQQIGTLPVELVGRLARAFQVSGPQ